MEIRVVARVLIVGVLMAVAVGPLTADQVKATDAATPSSSHVAAAASGEAWVTKTITACDKKKTVIVEGYRAGEVLPQEKARQVAKLLMALMKYCDYRVLARLPQQETAVYLSIEGQPFVEMQEVEQKLPLLLVQGVLPTEREKRVWAAEQKRMIEEGYKLFHNSALGTNGISCDMCHPDASNTHPETYPKFQTQLKTVALLRDQINWCIENPLEGKKLSGDDPKMKAMEAYIYSARSGKSLEPGKH